MTTLSSKYFALPRRQLMVLILFLGAGLLPKNSLADPAGAESSVQCWAQSCEPLFGAKTEDCVKPPAEAGLRTESCSTGYCYTDITYHEGVTRSERKCADGYLLPCFKDKPCIISDFSKPEEWDEYNRNTWCATDAQWNSAQPGRPNPIPTPTFPTDKKPILPGGSIRCVCKGNLCNNNTAPFLRPPPTASTSSPTRSGAAGVKPVGSSVALVGALLVAIFPLRRMFLVG